jgi:hypothetical protein
MSARWFSTGKPSVAHEYKNGVCIYCSMPKTVVDQLSHACTIAREKQVFDEASHG